MSAKKTQKKATTKKPAKENPAYKYFHEAAFDVIRQAQWGDSYDCELMDALSRLDQAEAFMLIDFEALEPRIESGELTREWWNRKAAHADLQAARNDFWIVKERIGAERGGENVFGIIAEHSARLAEWRESSKHDNPEVAIVAWLAEWLSKADGVVPTFRRVGDLLAALKGIGPLFDGMGGVGTHAKAVDKAIKLRVERQKKRASQRMGTIYPKPWKRHSTRWEVAYAKRWKGMYEKEMMAIAKRIHDDKKLFPRKGPKPRCVEPITVKPEWQKYVKPKPHLDEFPESPRIDKLMKGVPLPLKSGVDKSSPLFGR